MSVPSNDDALSLGSLADSDYPSASMADEEDDDGRSNDDDKDDPSWSALDSVPKSGDSATSVARKRNNMSREERKKEDMQKVVDRIDALSGRLKEAMGQVVYYPQSCPTSLLTNGKPAEQARDSLRQHLPIGTATDLASLRKNRDPHVHYTFYASEYDYIERELNALRRHLLQ